MTQVTDHDWALLNALADGELPADEAEALSQRIEADPELADMLASIQQVSHALSALKPDTVPDTIVQSAPANVNWQPWPWSWLVGGAIAAAMSVMVFFANTSKSVDPAAIHALYAAQMFPVASAQNIQMVLGAEIDGFPSLVGANLTLVVTKTDTAATSAHYVGVNGCRLTVLQGAGEQPALPQKLQSIQWRVGERWYQALASGMDPIKFKAVSAYLQQATRRQATKVDVVALHGATNAAAPCA
ncbi:anti-sigma factor [Roseovarius sp. EL26]|uniref:anti-sigma factor family protein n=1 Tax=Roseovarius sp. EL26 TaxID=2126672 RepID=UPI000EA1F974|nr:hypothetical protein [Roseovarius sp. EL26]